MTALRLLRDALLTLERWIGAGSLLLLLGLALAQILARNFFATGLPVADTLTRYLVLYVTFFGAILAIHAHRHIKIDVLCAFLDETWLEWLYRPLQFLGALVCGLLAQAAWVYWLDEWNYTPEHLRWTVGLALVMPVGFGLLALHFVLSGLLGYHDRVDPA